MAHPLVEIPEKLYFRIGEVARLAGVEPYVLRFWETEFPALKPGKGPSGHRLYRRREVELALEIKRLLHEQGFTIAGARKQLKNGKKTRQSSLALSPGDEAYRAALAKVRGELREVLRLLNGKSR